MKVYLVRHGQSEGNKAGIHQDGSVLLSAHGVKQAESVAERFKNISVDGIIASDYTRARETAEHIAAVSGHSVETFPILREMKMPTSVVGRKHDESEVVDIKKLIKNNFHNPSWRHSDEETFIDVWKRSKEILAFLESRSQDNLVCVAHGTIILNVILTIIAGDYYSSHLYLAAKQAMHLENTGITLVEFDGEKWKILTWNDYAHLG